MSAQPSSQQIYESRNISNLDSGIGPHASFPHFGPIGSDVEFYAFFVTGKRYTAYEQNHQYDVGKDGGEVGHFPRRLWAWELVNEKEYDICRMCEKRLTV